MEIYSLLWKHVTSWLRKVYVRVFILEGVDASPSRMDALIVRITYPHIADDLIDHWLDVALCESDTTISGKDVPCSNMVTSVNAPQGFWCAAPPEVREDCGKVCDTEPRDET